MIKQRLDQCKVNQKTQTDQPEVVEKPIMSDIGI